MTDEEVWLQVFMELAKEGADPTWARREARKAVADYRKIRDERKSPK